MSTLSAMEQRMRTVGAAHAYTNDELAEALSWIWNCEPNEIEFVAYRLSGNRYVWDASDGNGNYVPLRRPTPISRQWIVDDENVARMLEDLDRWSDYRDEQDDRLATMRGVA